MCHITFFCVVPTSNQWEKLSQKHKSLMLNNQNNFYFGSIKVHFNYFALLWKTLLFVLDRWYELGLSSPIEICPKLPDGQRSALEVVQFSAQILQQSECLSIHLLAKWWSSWTVFLCVCLCIQTPRGGSIQPNNNKCVREERLPPAEAGCVQTWGFIQSCDPALLLLISYVIPISAMCSPIPTDLNMEFMAGYPQK